MATKCKFKIDKNVPLPKRYKNCKTRYPWLIMDIGDSFYFEIKDQSKVISRRATVISNANRYARQHKLKLQFTSRITEKGFRIWRIA